MLRRTPFLPSAILLTLALACGEPGETSRTAAGDVAADRAIGAPVIVGPGAATPSGRTPNEAGRIPVLMYHIVGDKEASWSRERTNFRKDLEHLYERGYRPVNMVDVLDRRIDLPAGMSPVVFTFDDASPSQFRYVERDGRLEIDSTSAVGIWLSFAKTHPGWENKAVFCMLPAATHGHAFFGDKDIEGQKTAWRLLKVKQLAELGFELCNHTLWHARLDKYDDAMVQEQIARGVMAIDSAVPGYKVRTFALPLGLWPKNRALAKRGSWTDPRTKRDVGYDFDAILEVSGGPVPSPHTEKFNPLSVQRIKASGTLVANALDRLERAGERYVSDGDPRTIVKPTAPTHAMAAGR